MLTAADVRWTVAPSPVRNVLELSDEELSIDSLIDAESFRTLALVAIEQITNLQHQLDRLREQHHQLVDEYRAHRARIMREAVHS